MPQGAAKRRHGKSLPLEVPAAGGARVGTAYGAHAGETLLRYATTVTFDVTAIS